MFKKKIPWMIVFLVLMVISIWAVISRSESYSIELLKETLKNSNVFWLIAAFIGMFCNILFEGLALDVLVKALTKSEHTPPVKSNGLLYSAADIYFSTITPSASGGQPASAFFMSRDGIPMAKSAVILVTNMLWYTISLIFVSIIGFALAPRIFLGFDTLAKTLIIIGFVFMIGLCFIFILVLKKEQWIKHLALVFINIGAKFHIVRHKEDRINKMELSIRQYKACASLIKEEKLAMLKAFGFNFLQRLALLSTTILVYLSFGGDFRNLPEVISVQAMVLVGVYSIPVPGGIGVADYILINGLEMIGDIQSPANLELISRGISFYSCVFLSVVIVIAGYFIQNKRIKKEAAASKK